MSSRSSEKYIITKFLSVGLCNDIVNIYVKDRPFMHCRYLLINVPKNNEELQEDSLDMDYIPEELGITREQEFWAYCSSLKAWAENNYEPLLMPSNFSFSLLRELTEAGDPVAKKVYKQEILDRLLTGHKMVVEYIIREGYLEIFSSEEIPPNIVSLIEIF